MSSPLNLSPFWLLLVLLLTVQVDGQFFTKSSKSIPRMGRRSDSSDALIALANFRRAIIDDIVDKFGPELNELVAKVSQFNMQEYSSLTTLTLINLMMDDC